MRTVSKGFKHEETFPLPVWHDEKAVLQYDSNWADEMVCKAYGNDTEKYEINPSTLELFYKVSNKMRFKVAEISYESYFTDIKGQEWEKEWMETWVGINDENKNEGLSTHSPDEYEMYNLTLYHFDHPALKSNLLQKDGKLKGIDGEEYIKGIMEKLEREDEDEDDPYYS
tara:strand:+ start:1263 stop:1772 length:510 start_codon:yes stop_codon:yes gene_type:complete